MKNIIPGLFLIIAVLSTASHSQQQTLVNLEMTIQEDWDRTTCIIGSQGYGLRSQNNTRERTYTFNGKSTLRVFIGTSDYPKMSQSCGSRVFYFLPYKAKTSPSYQQTGADRVEAQLPSGHRAAFSTTTGELIWIEGYTVTTTPLVHFDQMVKSKGGVEIVPEKGSILIDCGFRTGGSPQTQFWRTAEISDGYGNKATVKMSDLFQKDPGDPDVVHFKFNSNEEFDQFLGKKCPKIKK